MKLEFESNPAALPMVNQNEVDANESTSSTNDESSPEVTQMLRDGIKAAQEGDRAEARTLLLKVTEADSNNENAWLWLASISEYPEELLVFLKNVLNINPKNERAVEWAKATESLMAKTFVQRGIEAAKNEQKDFAKQCFLQAIVHDNQSELAWLWLASVSNSTEEKVSHLQKVLAINPENENALSSLRNTKAQMAKALLPKANQAAISGKREEALKYLDQILSEAPGFEDAWMLKAHLADSFDEKITYFERVLEANPNNQVAKANLDSLQTFAADSESAEENSETANDVEMEEKVEMEASDENSLPEIAEEEPAFDEEVEIASDHVEEESVEEILLHEEAELEQDEIEDDFDDLSIELASEQDEDLTSEIENGFEMKEEEQEEIHFEEEAVSEPILNEETSIEPEEFEPEEAELESNEPVLEISPAPDLEIEEEPNSPSDSFESEDLDLDDVALEYDLLDEQPQEKPVEESVETSEAKDSAEESVEEMNPAEEKAHSEEIVEEPVSQEPLMPQFENAALEMQTPNFGESNSESTMACPFCDKENDQQVFACSSCKAILTLSDIEMLLSQENADQEKIGKAVEKMKADKSLRGVDLDELKMMGIGYINLKEYRKGFDCLKEASKKDADDVMLSSQIDALAIRISEIEEQVNAKPAPSRSKKILVVDDSPTVRKLISGKLEKCGHEAVCAVDGMDALAKINEVIPDLILLDITMPRMDGYQVCKLIRGNEATQDVPVVMISGKDGFFDKVRGKMAGTSNYITKPFGPETLMKAVNEYIA